MEEPEGTNKKQVSKTCQTSIRKTLSNLYNRSFRCLAILRQAEVSSEPKRLSVMVNSHLEHDKQKTFYNNHLILVY